MIDMGTPRNPDLPGSWTSETRHKGNTQRDGGQSSDAPVTNEALPIGTQAQQTQTSSTKQAQGAGKDIRIAQVSTPTHPPNDSRPVPPTPLDTDSTTPSATISSILVPTSDGMSDIISPVPTRTTMATSTTTFSKEELKGTVAPETMTTEPESSRKIPLFFPIDTASSTAISIAPTLATVPLSSSMPASNSNGTRIADIVPAGKSPTVNIAYAAIAPAVFAMLVLAAIFMRRKQKRRRASEAEANPRSGGVLSGDGKAGVGAGGVPIIAIPTPPSRKGGGGRGRTNTLGKNDGKGMELRPLPSSTLTSIELPERARTENERELRDSDIYSPRYGTPSNHTSASSAKGQDSTPITRVGILPSVPSIELEDPDGHQIPPQTPPPTLPPLPSPDLNENWLPSRMGSPVQSSPARRAPRYISSPAKASPPRTPPETSSPLNAASPRLSPPIRGPAIASSPSNNLIATPFHKNYKRTSDAPNSVASISASNLSFSTIPTQEASEVVFQRTRGVKEVGETEKG